MRLHMNGTAEDIRSGKIPVDLNKNAMALNLMALDGVWRFIGNPIVTHEYQETTAAHTERTLKTGQKLVADSIQNPDTRKGISKKLNTLIGGHDAGEIFGEPITARLEMDPEHKARMEKYKPALVEGNIAVFSYLLAIKATKKRSDALYLDTVAEIRERVLPKDWQMRSMNAQELVHFYVESDALIGSKTKEHKLDTKTISAESERFAAHYFDIEQERSFLGRIGKVLEKSDGSGHAYAVATARLAAQTPPYYHYMPSREPLQTSAPRYEKNLGKLYELAFVADSDVTNEEDRIKLVMGVAGIAYKTSYNIMSRCKSYINLTMPDYEPEAHEDQSLHILYEQNKGMHPGAYDSARADLIDRGLDQEIKPNRVLLAQYQEAIDDLTRGILWVPESGKSLSSSAEIKKIETPLYKPKIIHSLS